LDKSAFAPSIQALAGADASSRRPSGSRGLRAQKRREAPLRLGNDGLIAERAQHAQHPRAQHRPIRGFARRQRRAHASAPVFAAGAPAEQVVDPLKGKKLPVELVCPRFAIAVVTLNNRTISPVAQLFVDRAREIAAQLKIQRSGKAKTGRMLKQGAPGA